MPPDHDLDLKPTSFFALRRGNFPVICTYEAFLDYMENTIRFERSAFRYLSRFTYIR
jgi:hypothetical protein